jgi:hypothetical protein
MALAGRPLTLAAGAAAALPVAGSTARAVRTGWEPTDDKAIIATRAWDVLTRHPPLVGQYSEAGYVTGHPAHDLGPMLYWLLAVPVRLGDPPAMAVTMGIVNVAAILAVVALARRGGGLPLMLMTAVAIPVASTSLAAETFHDIWNPAAALFPFLLLTVLCWSLACGRHRLLPVTVLVASFVVQAHLALLAPALGMLAVGIAGLALSRPRRIAASVAIALVVGAACWAPAVVDQAGGRPGNLTGVVRDATARKATLGASVGVHAVERAIGARPWWLTVPRTRWDRKFDVRTTPSATRRLTSSALLVALVAVAIAGALRHRTDLAAAALIGLVLCAGLAVVAAATPTLPVLAATLGYTLWWATFAGMWVWLVVSWAGWVALAAAARAIEGRVGRRAPGRAARASWLPVALACGAGLGVVAVAGASAAAHEALDQHVALYRPIATIGARLDAAIPPARSVRLDGRLDVATQPFKAAVRFALARNGDRVLSRGATARNGAWYELDHHRYSTLVALTDRPRRPRRTMTLLTRQRFTEAGAAHAVFVWIARAGTSRPPEASPWRRSRAQRLGRITAPSSARPKPGLCATSQTCPSRSRKAPA